MQLLENGKRILHTCANVVNNIAPYTVISSYASFNFKLWQSDKQWLNIATFYIQALQCINIFCLTVFFAVCIVSH